MSLFEVEQEDLIEDINSAIYNFFVSLTSIFVRPHGAEIQEPGEDGEVRLHSLYIEQLDSRTIHHRTNEIQSIRAGEDVYIRTVDETEVNKLIFELSDQSGVDIENCNCFYVLMQMDTYVPEGKSLASTETENINEKINNFLNDGSFSVGNFSFIKAARSRYKDFSGTRLTKKGFDRVCVTYHLLLAQTVD